MSETEPTLPGIEKGENVFSGIFDWCKGLVKGLVGEKGDKVEGYRTEYLGRTGQFASEMKITAPNGNSTVVSVGSISELIKHFG